MRRAAATAINYRRALDEKNIEKEAKVQAQKTLQAVEIQLQRFKSKAESVHELRRNVNVLATIKQSRDRAEERLANVFV